MPKILVIDDSPFMRHQVRTYLEAAGHEVVEFLPLSALQVIDKVREVQPDLVLSDYNMLLSTHLVQGVDVWINTPRRPWEAMKIRSQWLSRAAARMAS